MLQDPAHLVCGILWIYVIESDGFPDLLAYTITHQFRKYTTVSLACTAATSLTTTLSLPKATISRPIQSTLLDASLNHVKDMLISQNGSYSMLFQRQPTCTCILHFAI